MTEPRRAAVFVDRDRTLIEDPGYLRDPNQVRLCPGVAEAVARLREAGYPVVVVSNQSGVARGYLTEEDLAAIHQQMQDLLRAEGSGVDAIYYCPFLDDPEAVIEEYRRDSDLRKPKPGMLLLAAEEMGLDLESSWMIGDATRDIQAGLAAGCRTVLIGNGEVEPSAAPDFVAADLRGAADLVLRESFRQAYDAGLSAVSNAPPPGEGAGIDAPPVEAETPPPAASPEPKEEPSIEPPSPTPAELTGESEIESPAEPASKPPEPEGESVVPAPQAAASPLPETETPSAPVVESAREAPHGEAGRIESTLGEILEELRMMKRERRYAEFSIAHLVGAIAQAFALCAVFWGIYAAVDGRLATAQIRILAGVAFQLMALTGLSFGHRK
ncbi:MAG: HAD-IIIA family hydrolase [Phycisphaerae bacterium]